MEWYLKVLKNWNNFDGRAARTEFWMFVLINFVVSLILSALGQKISIFGILSILYSLFVLIPAIAVGVRRLHDIGKSGWWYLIVFVPFLGALVLLYFFILDSQEGENEYGPNPKEIEMQ